MVKTFSHLLKGIAVAGLTLSLMSTSAFATENSTANANVGQEQVPLLRYNCATGEYTHQTFEVGDTSSTDEELACAYFPSNTEGISTCAIIDGEDRTRVNPTNVGPYCNTCYMVTTFDDGSKSPVFSGFILGPTSAVTAEHCVYDDKTGRKAKSVKVVPAKNGAYEPYGSAESTNIVHSEDYIKYGKREDDWAIIELDWNIGNGCGWLGLDSQVYYNGTEVWNTGYPGQSGAPMQNEEASYMILATGKVRETYAGSSENSGLLYGDWDASGGNSGGPVFAYYASKGHSAIGILTAGTSNNGSYGEAHTTATRISKKMFDLFLTYRR